MAKKKRELTDAELDKPDEYLQYGSLRNRRFHFV